MKFKCLLLIFAFTIVLANAAPSFKRDANAEAQLAVAQETTWWERDADAEAHPPRKRDAGRWKVTAM
ncbi:unnamed protein product [Rhizophagus irregularis]|nr:unnamed protein product [Rhizophagus irregularis]CAB4418873.1 unnamed protein product [Rhizophagus irregularis]